MQVRLTKVMNTRDEEKGEKCMRRADLRPPDAKEIKQLQCQFMGNKFPQMTEWEAATRKEREAGKD